MWPFDSETVSGHASASHKALYEMLHDGPGPKPLADAVQVWENNIAERFRHVEEIIRNTLNEVHAVWEGESADAMHTDSQPMTTFAGDAADTSTQIASSVQRQADDYTQARDTMPPPVKVDKTDSGLERGWAHVWGNKTDKEVQEEQAAAEAERAQRIYNQYQDNSRYNYGITPSYSTVAQDTNLVVAETGGNAGVDYGRRDGYVGGNNTGSGNQPGYGSYPPGGQPSYPGGPGGGIPGPGHGGGPRPGPGPVTPGPGLPGVPGGPGSGPGGGPAQPRLPGSSATPIPMPFGVPGGGDQGDSKRWKRTVGPGLFEEDGFSKRGGAGGGAAGTKGGASGAGAGPGKGGVLGGVGDEPHGSPRSGAAGTRGAVGMAGAAGPMGAGGVRGNKEEDKEHQAPDYLVESEDIWGTGEKVAPPVIGE